jgi:hypothetical protein
MEAFATSYNAMVGGLGNQLVLELQTTLERIVLFPRAHQLCFGEHRRAVLHRFPLQSVFE